MELILLTGTNWNITWAVAQEVINTNFLITHFIMIHENTFLRLDKLWKHQDVNHDFTANLTRIGDRSVHEICEVLFCI